MPVLYRKYRPQTFQDVVGQDPVIQTLQNAVKNGTVAHAYLFTGSRGVGKTSVARILAKAVNCLDKPDTGDACGQCEVCMAIVSGGLLDLVEIDAASNTGVDNVRELIEHVKFKPSRTQFKVFIIDEVHMLSKAAFNALLKTLEEPPEHAIFILATTDIEKVPATIISRTQRFDFRKISELDMVKELERISKIEQLNFDTEILALIAARAQGGLRDALSLLDKVGSLGGDITLAEAQSLLGLTSIALSQNLISVIIEGNAERLPGLFDELSADGVDFLAFNRDLLEYVRKLLVKKIAGDAAVIDLLPADLEVLSSQAAKVTPSELIHLTRLFLRSYKELSGAPSPDLPLLLAAIEASLKNSGPVPVAARSAVAQPATLSVVQPMVASESKEAPSEPLEAVINPVSEPAVNPSLDDVTLEEINRAWPQVIEKIRAVNSPLATLVKNSPLQSAAQGVVVIGVKYLFHKERLESKKHYALLVTSIKEASGKQVRIVVKIIKDQNEPGLVQSLDAISDALKVFGGELVE